MDWLFPVLATIFLLFFVFMAWVIFWGVPAEQQAFRDLCAAQGMKAGFSRNLNFCIDDKGALYIIKR